MSLPPCYRAPKDPYGTFLFGCGVALSLVVLFGPAVLHMSAGDAIVFAFTFVACVLALWIGNFLVNRNWFVLGGMFMGPSSLLLALIGFILMFGGG